LAANHHHADAEVAGRMGGAAFAFYDRLDYAVHPGFIEATSCFVSHLCVSF
jgi:hypothetical protein